MISRVAYQARTPDFWQACDGTAGPAYWRQYGTTGDAKGEPTQINSISHGCSPTRFRRSTSCSRINAMLTRDEAQKLAQKVIGLLDVSGMPGDASRRREQAYTRFANNGITTASLNLRHTVAITVTRDGTAGRMTVNDLDDASLRAAVKKAEELAAIAPPNPERLPPLGPQEYPETQRFRRARRPARGRPR